jgi:hypothetical protein
VKLLAAGLLKSTCTPATRLELLQQLAADVSPPEDQPVGSVKPHSTAVCLQTARRCCPDGQRHQCMCCPAFDIHMQLRPLPPIRLCILCVVSVDRGQSAAVFFETVPDPMQFGSQMDVLDKSSACAIAIALRGMDPDKLGAAAVPLVIALVRYEVDGNNKVGRRQQAVIPVRSRDCRSYNQSAF